jgi:hypothetical protein
MSGSAASTAAVRLTRFSGFSADGNRARTTGPFRQRLGGSHSPMRAKPTDSGEHEQRSSADTENNAQMRVLVWAQLKAQSDSPKPETPHERLKSHAAYPTAGGR